MVDSKELEEILTRGLHNKAHARVIAEAIRGATADNEAHAQVIEETIREATAGLKQRSRHPSGTVDDRMGDDEMGDPLFGSHLRKAFRTIRGRA